MVLTASFRLHLAACAPHQRPDKITTDAIEREAILPLVSRETFALSPPRHTELCQMPL